MVVALKGAEDYRKEAEAKQKQQSAVVDQAKQAQLAKEQEARENARVAALVAELNQKNYRAPISDVQCSPERDACLQCYRDKQSDVLQCKQVADAFIRCAQVHTEVRAGWIQDGGETSRTDTCRMRVMLAEICQGGLRCFVLAVTSTIGSWSRRFVNGERLGAGWREGKYSSHRSGFSFCFAIHPPNAIRFCLSHGAVY